VILIAAQGRQSPNHGYAGQQERASVPENTVIQEVVRAYLWGDGLARAGNCGSKTGRGNNDEQDRWD